MKVTADWTKANRLAKEIYQMSKLSEEELNQKVSFGFIMIFKQ